MRDKIRDTYVALMINGRVDFEVKIFSKLFLVCFLCLYSFGLTVHGTSVCPTVPLSRILVTPVHHRRENLSY